MCIRPFSSTYSVRQDAHDQGIEKNPNGKRKKELELCMITSFPKSFGTLSRHSNTIHSLKTSSQGDKGLEQTFTSKHLRQTSAWFALSLWKSTQGIQTYTHGHRDCTVHIAKGDTKPNRKVNDKCMNKNSLQKK